ACLLHRQEPSWPAWRYGCYEHHALGRWQKAALHRALRWRPQEYVFLYEYSRPEFPFSRLLSSCHHHFAKHPHIHVQHQMAVPGPSSESVGCHEKTDTLGGLHGDRVATRLKLSVRRFEFAPHPVKVHGMRHHGVVVQNEPDPLSVTKVSRWRLTELHAIK